MADVPHRLPPRDAVVPVWDARRDPDCLSAREYWRIRLRRPSTKCLSAYLGAARGWRGAQGWTTRWSPLVGPRATVALDLPGSYTADVVGEASW